MKDATALLICFLLGGWLVGMVLAPVFARQSSKRGSPGSFEAFSTAYVSAGVIVVAVGTALGRVSWSAGSVGAGHAAVAVGVIVGFGAAAALVVVELVVIGFSERRSHTEAHFAGEPLVATGPSLLRLLVIPGAILEELVWRGAFAHAMGPSVATVVVVGVLFGAWHLPFGVKGASLKAVDGIVWTALFVTTHGILAPIVSHVAFNAFVVLVAWRRPTAVEAAVEALSPVASSNQGDGACPQS